MNLLVIAQYGETTSGPSRVVTELMRRLSPDIQVLVLSPKRRRDTRKRNFSQGSLRVVFQPCGRIPGVPGSHQPIEILRLARRLASLDFRADVVWVHSESAYLAYRLSKYRGLPCLATVHGVFGSFYQREALLKLGSALVRLFSAQSRLLQRIEFRKATLLTTYSEYLRRQILKTSPHSRVVVIPNGVNASRFTPAKGARQETIVYVGRMAAIKGVHILIESMKRVLREAPGWRLLLIGGAMDQPKSFFEKFMQPSTKRLIEFVGPIPNAQLPAILAKSGIFVMPTLRDGFEIALMEAMATGIPCITTGAYERTDLYGGYAELVPPSDSNALAEAILRIVNNYNSYVTEEARMKRVTRAREFDWSQIAHRYEKLLRVMAR